MAALVCCLTGGPAVRPGGFSELFSAPPLETAFKTLLRNTANKGQNPRLAWWAEQTWMNRHNWTLPTCSMLFTGTSSDGSWCLITTRGRKHCILVPMMMTKGIIRKKAGEKPTFLTLRCWICVKVRFRVWPYSQFKHNNKEVIEKSKAKWKKRAFW